MLSPGINDFFYQTDWKKNPIQLNSSQTIRSTDIRYNNANFHWNKQTLKVVKLHLECHMMNRIIRSDHFIWNLLSSPKAYLINFIWNDHSRKILYIRHNRGIEIAKVYLMKITDNLDHPFLCCIIYKLLWKEYKGVAPITQYMHVRNENSKTQGS